MQPIPISGSVITADPQSIFHLRAAQATLR
jgi:hypothetical protein